MAHGGNEQTDAANRHDARAIRQSAAVATFVAPRRFGDKATGVVADALFSFTVSFFWLPPVNDRSSVWFMIGHHVLSNKLIQ